MQQLTIIALSAMNFCNLCRSLKIYTILHKGSLFYSKNVSNNGDWKAFFRNPCLNKWHTNIKLTRMSGEYMSLEHLGGSRSIYMFQVSYVMVCPINPDNANHDLVASGHRFAVQLTMSSSSQFISPGLILHLSYRYQKCIKWQQGPTV